MKYCIKCGAPLEDDANFCNNCGERQNETSNDDAPYNSNSYNTGSDNFNPNISESNVLSFSEYVDRFESSSVRNVIKAFAVICFVLGGISIVSVFLLGIAALLDVLIYIGLGYGILKKKSAVCGLVFTVYYALGSLIVMNAVDTPTNIMRIALLAFFIMGTVYLFSAKKRYKKYLLDNFKIMM